MCGTGFFGQLLDEESILVLIVFVFKALEEEETKVLAQTNTWSFFCKFF